MRLDSIATMAPHLIERLEHFRNFTMAHPRLVEARDELADAIDGAAPGSLVLVLGPTGVGKTTLRMKVENLLMQQMAPAMAADPGRLPFVSTEVVPPDTGRFRWRDYFSRLLAAMNEPLIDFKTLRGTARTRVLNTLPSPVGGIELDMPSSKPSVTGALQWSSSTKRNTLHGLLPAGVYPINWMSSSRLPIAPRPCTCCWGPMNYSPFVI